LLFENKFDALNQNYRRRNPSKAGLSHFTKIRAYLFFFILPDPFLPIVLVMLFPKPIAGNPCPITAQMDLFFPY